VELQKEAVQEEDQEQIEEFQQSVKSIVYKANSAPETGPPPILTRQGLKKKKKKVLGVKVIPISKDSPKKRKSISDINQTATKKKKVGPTTTSSTNEEENELKPAEIKDKGNKPAKKFSLVDY